MDSEGPAELYLPVGSSQPHPAQGQCCLLSWPRAGSGPLLPLCWVLAGHSLLLHACLIYTNAATSGLSFPLQFRQSPQSKELIQQG